jgi:hypothetical protein
VQHEIDELRRGLIAREVTAGAHGAAHGRIEGLDRVRNRYEIVGACVRLRFVLSQRMVRPSGTEAPGA